MGDRISQVLFEVKRKSIHVIPGFAAIPIVVWLGKHVAIPIAVLFLALYTLNELYLKGIVKFKAPIAYQTYRIMARREEVEKRYFTGTIYFWTMTVAVIVLLEPVKAAATVMVSSLGDAAAAITGKAFPNPRNPLNRGKSIAGSIAMFAVSLLSCIVAGISVKTSLIVALLATVTEALTTISVLDELTVPVVTATTLWLL